MKIDDYLMQTGNFRMIDRIVHIESRVSSEAEKEVRADEFWVKDHFPGYPVFPGVLLLEAMGQTGGLLLQNGKAKKDYGFLNKVEHFKILHPVHIGDVIVMKAEFLHSIGIFSVVKVKAFVKEKLTASAEITYALPDGKI